MTSQETVEVIVATHLLEIKNRTTVKTCTAKNVRDEIHDGIYPCARVSNPFNSDEDSLVLVETDPYQYIRYDEYLFKMDESRWELVRIDNDD